MTGACPGCAGTEWRLAKVIVLEGTVDIQTESSGSSVGVSVGVGRGMGGVSGSYHGLDLSTRGTQTTLAAQRHAPPIRPNKFEEKGYLLVSCRDMVDSAETTIKAAADFGESPEATRGFFAIGYDISLSSSKDTYEEVRSHLAKIAKHERTITLWEKTRVCSRCGEGFVTQAEVDAFRPSFEVPPPFEFPGINHRCPACKSIEWKSLERYAAIRLSHLERRLKEAQAALQKAEEAILSPNPGFFSRLARRVIPPNPKERAEDVLVRDMELERFIQALKVAQSQEAFTRTRVCMSDECGTHYTLETDSSNRVMPKVQFFA